jgi:Zinc knuckle
MDWFVDRVADLVACWRRLVVGVGHAKIDCPNGACFNCGGRGHLSRECSMKVYHLCWMCCAGRWAVGALACVCDGRTNTLAFGVCRDARVLLAVVAVLHHQVMTVVVMRGTAAMTIGVMLRQPVISHVMTPTVVMIAQWSVGTAPGLGRHCLHLLLGVAAVEAVIVTRGMLVQPRLPPQLAPLLHGLTVGLPPHATSVARKVTFVVSAPCWCLEALRRRHHIHHGNVNPLTATVIVVVITVTIVGGICVTIGVMCVMNVSIALHLLLPRQSLLLSWILASWIC